MRLINKISNTTLFFRDQLFDQGKARNRIVGLTHEIELQCRCCEALQNTVVKILRQPHFLSCSNSYLSLPLKRETVQSHADPTGHEFDQYQVVITLTTTVQNKNAARTCCSRKSGCNDLANSKFCRPDLCGLPAKLFALDQLKKEGIWS